jgi:chromosome segregation ATPase
MKKKYESCQDEIGKKTSALEEAQRKNGENDGHTSELQKQLQNLTNIIEEQKVNMSAAEKVGIDQQATIINLKETVEKLAPDLLQLSVFF